MSCFLHDLAVIPNAIIIGLFSAGTFVIVHIITLGIGDPISKVVILARGDGLGAFSAAERTGVLDLSFLEVCGVLYYLAIIPLALSFLLGLTALALAIVSVLGGLKRLPLAKAMLCRLVYCLGLFCTAESAGISRLAFLKMSRLFRLLSVIPITVAVFLLATLALAVMSAVALRIGNIVAVYMLVIIGNAEGRYLGRKLTVKYLRNVEVDLTL